jgi:polysaccharide biosynthesis transport protein
MIEESKPTYELSPYHRLQDTMRVPGYGAWAEPADDADAFDIRKYWGIIYKHRYVIGVVFLAVVSLVALNVFTAGRLYSSVATIQIEREAPNVAPVRGVEYMESGADDFYVTQYRILLSRSIAARVIRELKLADDPRFFAFGGRGIVLESLQKAIRFVIRLVPFRPSRTSDQGAGEAAPQEELGVPIALIDQYLGMLSVQPIFGSRLVGISFTTPSPALSAAIANAHVVAYREFIIDQRATLSTQAKEILEEELAKAKERLTTAEASMNRFRKEREVVGLEGEPTDVVNAQFVDLSERLTKAQAERIALESQYQLVQERRYESIPAVARDDTYRTLNQQLGQVRATRAELSQKFKPAYPVLREVIARERELQTQINTHVRRIVATVESAYLEAKRHEELLQQRFDVQRGRSLAQKDISADYQTLKRDVSSAQEIYTSLLQRLKDVDVAEEIKVTNVWTVDRAAIPLLASYPRRLKTLLYAVGAGLTLGILLAVLLENLDNTVKSPEDVTRHLRLPTLGVVPSFRHGLKTYGYGRPEKQSWLNRRRFLGRRDSESEGSRRSGGDLVLEDRPRSLVAEAYRTIRTGILLSAADSQPKVIVITSSAAREGKTVTAINQAMALAEMGAKVVLLDGDIRQPRLRSIFNLPEASGLSNYLTGQASLEAVLFEIHRKGNGNGSKAAGTWGLLHVIPSGPLPPNPAELLGSRKMQDLIARLRDEYDYIVIDTPPALPVTDAVLLSSMADKVLLVVRAHETPIDVVVKCVERLLGARTSLLGVVLNDVDLASLGYGKRKYYSYYEDPGAVSSEA